MHTTARLYTRCVQIECGYCRRLITHPNGGYDFAPEDLNFGGGVKCDKEDCGMESKLTTTPKATVEDVLTLRAAAVGAEG